MEVFHPLFRFEVEDDGLLTPVDLVEVGAVLVGIRIGAHEPRDYPPLRVALRGLDLGDLGAVLEEGVLGEGA